MAKYDYQGSRHYYKKREESGGWMGAVAIGVGILILIGIFA